MNILKKFFSNRINLVWIVFISFVLTFFFTQNSPFYKYDTWADSSVYTQVGHSWLTKGILPYKGIFDHKGPLHFLLFGLGSLIRYKDSFIGIYFIEGILLSVTNYFYFKTTNLFVESKKISLLIVTFVQLLLFSTINFNIHEDYMTRNVLLFERGGSPEEFCLPYISVIVYFVCKFFKEGKIDFSNKQWLLIGLCISAIFLEKFTISVPFFILLFAASIHLLIKDREQLSRQIIFGWSFAIIPLILVILYFIVNGAIGDFITYYFKVNIFNYSEGQNLSLVKKVFYGLTIGISMLKNNVLLLALFIGGVFTFIFTNKLKNSDKVVMLIILAMMYVINLLPGRSYSHYLLPIMPIIMVSVALFYNEKWNKLLLTNFNFKIVVMFIIILFVTIGSANEQMNFSKFKTGKEITPMEQMANIIKSDKNYSSEKTDLLVINCNFVMLHSLTNTTPKSRFFYAPAMKVPEYNKEVKTDLKNKKPDYIYMNSNYFENEKFKSPMNLFFKNININDRNEYKKYLENYKLVYFKQDKNKFTKLNYFLLKRK